MIILSQSVSQSVRYRHHTANYKEIIIIIITEIFFIDLDYKHGYLYYVEGSSIHSAPNAFRRVDLRDVVFANVQTLFPDVSTADIISYLVEDKRYCYLYL